MKKLKLSKLLAMVLSLAIICVFSFTGCGSKTKTEEASEERATAADITIIYDGVVEQIKGDADGATAVVLKGDTIEYVGSDEGAMKYDGDSAVKYDAEGNTIMPSLVDAHLHFSSGIQKKYEVSLADVIDVDEMKSIIKEYVDANPDLENYNGGGWMQSAFDVKTGPLASTLDEVCPDKPMVLQNVDGHGYWANTKALEYVEDELAKGVEGVVGNSVEEYNKHSQENGGRIIVDKNGKPSGWLKESAGNLINGLLNDYTVDQCKEAIKEQQEWLNRNGFTTFFDAGVLMSGKTVDNYYTAMKEMSEDGDLTVKVRGSFWVQGYDFNVLDEEGNYDPAASSKKLAKYLNKWKKRAKELSGSDYYKITTVKTMADQVLEGGTAYMSDGMYSDEFVEKSLKGDSETNNIWAGKDDLMQQSMEFAAENGFNYHIHTIGDAAVTMALDNLEKVAAEYPELKENNRVSLAHCQFINDNDKQRMADLGVSAIVAPYWACMDDYYWNVYLPIMSSKDKLDTQYPMQSLEKLGINVAFHSDYFVTDPDMGWLFYSAQTRCLPQKIFNLWYGKDSKEYKRDTNPYASQNPEDYGKGVTPILPLKQYDERLDFDQVMEAATINGAKTVGLADECGSLEKGKKGNIIVLNMDLRKTNEENIEKVENVTPNYTFFEGAPVYDYKKAEENK